MSRLKGLLKTSEWSGRRLDLLALAVLLVGLLIRLWAASSSFVNPDEAYHALLATPQSFGDLYASAVRSPHPPLFVLMLHYVRQISTSDLALRIVPVICGVLFPWVMYRWISRGWSKFAGVGALAILTFAPELIRVSTEARGYAQALLCMAVALYLMDRAIEDSSALKMAGFGLALFGAVLSEYSAAFFVLASGVYFLLRITEKKVTTGVRIVWELSQVGAVVLYSGLWVTQVHPMQAIATTRSDVEGWLAGSYLHPGQNPLEFLVVNTARQFAFILPLLVPAVAAILLFVAGIWMLWRKPPEGSLWRSRATIALLLVPFAAAYLAACVELFPYGRSRHTIFLALFIATGVSISADRFARAWVVPLVVLSVVVTPLWHAVEGQYRWEIGRVENRQEYMTRAIDFLKRSVPPGTVLLTEGEMRVVLSYYMDTGVRAPEAQGTPSQEIIGGYKMFAGRWAFGSLDDLRDDLRVMRGHYGLGPEARIWVLDGGFLAMLEPALLDLRDQGELPDVFQFGRAMVAVLTPEGFLWEPPTLKDMIPAPEESSTPDFNPRPLPLAPAQTDLETGSAVMPTSGG